MKKALVLMGAFLLLAASASAVPTVCADYPSPFVVQNVLAAGFSCTLGPLTFSNFSLVDATSGIPVGIIDLVTADLSGGNVILNFNPSLAVPAGGRADGWFYFQVDGGINGIDLAVSGLGASITELACSSPINTNGNNCSVAGTELARMVATSGTSGVVVFPNSTFVSPVYIYKDILLQGPAGSNGGELSSFSQSFAIPEPMTMALFGSGLLALGLVRRFRR